MGTRSEPLIAFGFPIGDESDLGIEGFEALMEAVDEGEDEDWPVQLVSHGHYECRYWFLSIRGTSSNGGDWGSVIEIPTREPQAEDIEAAKAWCKRHSLPWRKPAWFAMSQYR